MEIEQLKQSYKDHLVKAGVNFDRAEQVVKNLAREDLPLNRESAATIPQVGR